MIGRPDEKWGEVPVAVVALGAVADESISLGDLDEFLTERLARYKHPKALKVVDALPRNPAGKVLKTELRARFGVANEIDAGESSTPPTVSAGARRQLTAGGGFANGYGFNPADAVHSRDRIGYSPVVRLTTRE